jgi:hypothetical protein
MIPRRQFLFAKSTHDFTRDVCDTWRYTQLSLKRTFRVFFFISSYLCLHNLGLVGDGGVLMYCSSFRNSRFCFYWFLFYFRVIVYVLLGFSFMVFVCLLICFVVLFCFYSLFVFIYCLCYLIVLYHFFFESMSCYKMIFSHYVCLLMICITLYSWKLIVISYA